MGEALQKAAWFVGCALAIAGCGESVEQQSDGEIWAGSADIFVMRGSFEAVAVGERSGVEIILENRGEAPLRFREFEFVEVSDDSAAEFEFSGWPADDSAMVIYPDRTARLLLSYTPQNRTPDVARISFECNDPEDPSHTVDFEPELSE